MIKYFQNRSNNQSATALYNNIIELLGAHLDFIDPESKWVVNSVHFTRENYITYIHRLQAESKSKIENHKFNQISGVKIFSKLNENYKSLSIVSSGDVIQQIELGFDSLISKEFDIYDLIIEELKVRKIKIENPDFKIVSKLLKHLNSNQIKLLELNISFEIELFGKKYYTIVDLEDGNYLAIDNNISVYRLIHDHPEPIKLVYQHIDGFINKYNGNKKSLGYLFD